MRTPSPRVVTALAVLALCSAAATAAPGRLDPAFAGTGVSMVNFGPAASANAVAVAPDGKIVVTGSTNAMGNSDFAVMRYHPDGTLDTSFHSDGGVITDIADGDATDDFAQAVAVQPDGKVLVAGYYNSNAFGGTHMVVVRYNHDGSPDTFFGHGGRELIRIWGKDRATCLGLQSDGKILVGGTTFFPNVAETIAVVRLHANGVVDESFGGSGKWAAAFSFSTADTCRGMVVQPDGRIVIVGSATVSGGRDFAIARLTAGGELDPSFGMGGKLTVPHAGDDEAAGVAVRGGWIVVGGTRSIGSGADFAVGRFALADGAPDLSFAPGGVASHDLGGEDVAAALVVQPDGGIVVGGSTDVAGDKDFALVRFAGDGAADDSFGANGVVTSAIGTGTADEIRGMVLQRDGRLVVAGASAANDSVSNFAVARYHLLAAVDVRVGESSAASKGDGVYNNNGDRQTLGVRIRKSGGVATVYARIQNDGHEAESFKVTGRAGSSSFPVRYFHKKKDVTKAMLAGKLDTGRLKPGASYLLTIRIGAVTRSAGKSREFPIKAQSLTGSRPVDKVVIRAVSR